MKLSDYFYYDPSSPSCLRNKINRSSTQLKDQIQGTLNNRGYWQVQHQKKTTVQHRIVWELHFGPIPEGKVIDHIDRDKSNNRIENLRYVTQPENMTNQPQRNKSGFYQNQANGKYQVRSLKDRKYLKTVQTIEEQLELQDKDLQDRFGLSRQDLFCC